MANAPRISNNAAKAACDAIVDRLDLGSGNAKLRIYDGTQPTDPDTAIGAQTLLAELVMSDPAFGAAADANPGGRATADTITDDSSANADGTATWFTLVDSDNVRIFDGSVGTSSADLILNSVAISSGAVVSVTSLTILVPES